MPRVIRRAKRRKAALTDLHITQLLTGCCWFSNTAFGKEDRGTLDVDAMRKAWEALRDVIIPMWIEDYPCTRPYAWWEFDAKERRRRIDGPPHPFDKAGRDDLRLHFGVPNSLIDLDDFDAKYETEAAYLERLGLLTDYEREAMKTKSAELAAGQGFFNRGNDIADTQADIMADKTFDERVCEAVLA